MPLLLVLMTMLLKISATHASPPDQPVTPPAPGSGDRDFGRRLFVSVQQAAALHAGGATVLDARASGFWSGHVPGAQAVNWRDFVDGWGRVGRVHPSPEHMAKGLSALGVEDGHPVLVYGDAQKGYGEEGRIAWLLVYLGHPQVHILDGGIAAWRAGGQPLVRGFAGRPARVGPLHVHVQPSVRADKGQVVAANKGTMPPQIVDVRSLGEWRGATPYFEARGGHIPGAVHLDWLQLLDENGHLREASFLRHALSAIGLSDPNREIIVYCTGGVRSAFAWAVLRQLGYTHVRNYDGSFWEWSADRSLPVELEPKRP